jgi:nucleoside 2-deoxyribosyltransferase
MKLGPNPYGTKGLWYLATPYSAHPGGYQAAYDEATEQGAFLLAHGVPVFVPISHSHGIQAHGKTAHTYETWLYLDNLFLDACYGLIVCHIPGWERSKGIQYEIDYMLAAGKPVVHMEMNVVPRFP